MRPLLLALLLLLATAASAQANGAPSMFKGDRSGVVMPWRTSTVAVLHEDLIFDLAPDLGEARVTAAYELANEANTTQTVPVAFAIQGNTRREMSPSVSLAGRPLSALRIVWSEEEAASLSPADAAAIEEAWVGGEPTPLIDPVDGSVYDDEDFFGQEGDLEFLLFTVVLAPGSRARLEVAYTHGAALDRTRWANDLFHYFYLLQPARHWARFGGLTLRVSAPEELMLGSSLPLKREPGNGSGRVTYRGEFVGLPPGNLALGVMSTHGLWLGETSPAFYEGLTVWAVLAAATVAGLLSGWALARIGSLLGAILTAWLGVGSVGVMVGAAALGGMQSLLSVDAVGRGSFTYGAWLLVSFSSLISSALSLAVRSGLRWNHARHHSHKGGHP